MVLGKRQDELMDLAKILTQLRKIVRKAAEPKSAVLPHQKD